MATATHLNEHQHALVNLAKLMTEAQIGAARNLIEQINGVPGYGEMASLEEVVSVMQVLATNQLAAAYKSGNS